MLHLRYLTAVVSFHPRPLSLASAFTLVMCSISSSRRPRPHHDLPRLAHARFGSDALRRASHSPPHTVHSWKMFRAQPASMVIPRRSFHAPYAAVISSTHPSHPVTAHTPIHDISLPYFPLPFLLPFVIVLMSGCVWIVCFCNDLHSPLPLVLSIPSSLSVCFCC